MNPTDLLPSVVAAALEANAQGNLKPEEIVANTTNIGKFLAETKWKHVVEDIEDDYLRASTAVLLENQDVHFSKHPGYRQQKLLQDLARRVDRLDEDTTTSDIATIDRVAFPIIRGLSPNYIATDLVSVQPLLSPQGLVAYFKMTYTDNKGQAMAGTEPTESPDEFYGSEVVDRESLGTGDGSDTAFTGTLSWRPVRESTVVVVAGTVTGRDNGNGSITGTGIAAGSTINYTTGAITVNFTAAPASATAITVSYEYDGEANDSVPGLDVEVITAPVTARAHRIRTRWSIDSAQNLSSVFGLDAEEEFGSFVTGELKSETDRRILNEIDRIATADETSFNVSVSQGVPWADHKLQFADIITQGGYNIFRATKRARGNWIVMGTMVGDIVETLPNFVGSGVEDQEGVADVGTLSGKWRCYVDPFRANQSTYCIGHKSPNIAETGLIFAPYVALYMTPTVTLDDFLSRKGYYTSFGLQSVDGNYYSKGTLSGNRQADR